MMRSMRGSVVVMVVVAAVVASDLRAQPICGLLPARSSEPCRVCVPLRHSQDRIHHWAIGVDNVVKKIEGCGRTVPRKFKCGSITTP
ncbi:hypothetical protein CK203_112864 [Vitis vinifera]|uniref:Uncharacterized protein n=1 Tax=Vitis vinifera TaxID=29760 RepID=A0A438CEY7_VITVI|nr:hypothetical protein CK203_112864 [Vitis vinifera]